MYSVIDNLHQLSSIHFFSKSLTMLQNTNLLQQLLHLLIQYVRFYLHNAPFSNVICQSNPAKNSWNKNKIRVVFIHIHADAASLSTKSAQFYAFLAKDWCLVFTLRKKNEKRRYNCDFFLRVFFHYQPPHLNLKLYTMYEVNDAFLYK